MERVVEIPVEQWQRRQIAEQIKLVVSERGIKGPEDFTDSHVAEVMRKVGNNVKGRLGEEKAKIVIELSMGMEVSGYKIAKIA